MKILPCLAMAAVVTGGAGAGAARGAPPPRYAWELLDATTPHVLFTGREVTARVRVRNVGTETWQPNGLDRLSYHLLSPWGTIVSLDGRRTVMPHAVRPGEEVELAATIVAPRYTGVRRLEWEMLREGVSWWGPPVNHRHDRVWVLLLWLPSVYLGGLLLATALLAVVLRWFARPGAAWWWALATLSPAAWLWALAVAITVAFAQLSDLTLWNDAMPFVVSGALLLAFPVLLVPARVRAWVAGGLGALLAIIATADLLYMRWFGSLVPLVALSAVQQVPQVEGSVRALFRPGDAWLLCGAANAIVLVGLWPTWTKAQRPVRRVRVGVALAGIVAVVLGARSAAVTMNWALHDSSLMRQMFSQQQRVKQWGLFNLHVLDLARTAREAIHRTPLSDADRARALAFFAGRAAAAPPPGGLYGLARGANLLVIQVESLQEWVVGARIKGKPVTPVLDYLRDSGRALFFPYVFDETAQGRSSDGEFAALNSLHPLRQGAVAFLYPHNHFLALPRVLRDHGYTTLSAHPFERGFWNRAILHPLYGFTTSLFQRELGPGEMIGWGLADGAFFQRMVPTIAGLKQPFYVHLITLGLHHPFDKFPDRHKVLDIGHLAGSPLGNYIHAMHYFDASFGSLLLALRDKGLLDNTVVAIYGDHESGLVIDDGFLEASGEPRWDPSLPTRVRKVPFMVLVPGGKLHGDVPVVGGHIDIAPTLLYLLGVERPHSFAGIALAPGRDAIAALATGSAVDGRRIFVASGAKIPAGGACFTFPDGRPLARVECDALAKRADTELDVSEDVIEHDLVPLIAAGGAK